MVAGAIAGAALAGVVLDEEPDGQSAELPTNLSSPFVQSAAIVVSKSLTAVSQLAALAIPALEVINWFGVAIYPSI